MRISHTKEESRQSYSYACSDPFEISLRVEEQSQPVESLESEFVEFVSSLDLHPGEERDGMLFFPGFSMPLKLEVVKREQLLDFQHYRCALRTQVKADKIKLHNYLRTRVGPTCQALS